MTNFLNQSRELFTALLGLGLKAEELSLLQVTFRAIVVFVLAIAIVRCADKRHDRRQFRSRPGTPAFGGRELPLALGLASSLRGTIT